MRILPYRGRSAVLFRGRAETFRAHFPRPDIAVLVESIARVAPCHMMFETKQQNASTGSLGGSTLENKDSLKMRNTTPMKIDSNNYYDNIVSKKKQKKVLRNTRAAIFREEEKDTNTQTLEDIGTQSKRAISHAMAKNRGLMGHRKKDVRCPRIKRRKQYETRKSKLGSMQPLHRGGAQGPYEGEYTGFKTNLVKSVKL